MTLDQLFTSLQTVGIPVAYHQFRKKTPPPYIHYFVGSARSISADERSFGEIKHVSVDLCTEKMDVSMERRLEEVLQGYAYEKYQLYLEDEDVYQTTYEFDIVVKENEYAQ